MRRFSRQLVNNVFLSSVASDISLRIEPRQVSRSTSSPEQTEGEGEEKEEERKECAWSRIFSTNYHLRSVYWATRSTSTDQHNAEQLSPEENCNECLSESSTTDGPRGTTTDWDKFQLVKNRWKKKKKTRANRLPRSVSSIVSVAYDSNASRRKRMATPSNWSTAKKLDWRELPFSAVHLWD